MSAFQIQSSEVLARLKPFGISFEKSLSDLIKGIRAHSKESPESLSLFLDTAIEECKDELNTTDLEIKAMAILKLAYLEMYGFEMSWCNFHILEVMASNKFQQKRVGYLAAMQSFKNEQDLLILATNQFKKDLNSHNHIEIGLALSGIATIVTPNLSKDINDDVLMKLNHSKPYIRKKAILAMYKIFLQYPDSLRINFNRVIEKLDDEDISVVSATINVICEICKKNPKIFVNYLPKFFSLLEDTKNNWLIIRILKLFQSLSKVEPRMKKRILPSLVDLMTKTQASSLIYECINCIVNGGMLASDSFKDQEIAKLCVEQLMVFFRNGDANLKFVGLLALINVIKVYPDFIQSINGVSSIIMDCIVDEDLIIKRKALEVCHYLIDDANFVQLIKVLLLQLIPNNDNLRLEVTKKILTIGASDNYSNIPNFKWYIVVLKDMINLTLLPTNASASASKVSYSVSNSISTLIGEEFKTLATRIPSIRSTIMDVVVELILDARVSDNCPLLLKDFFWILGEYIDDIKIPIDSDQVDDDEDDDDEVEYSPVLSLEKKKEILNAFTFTIDKTSDISIPSSATEMSHKLIELKSVIVQAVLIQTLVKVYSSIVADYKALYSQGGRLPHRRFVELAYILTKLIRFISYFENHTSYEVQERSLSWLEFLRICLEAMIANDTAEVDILFDEEIKFLKLSSAKHSQADEDDEENDQSSGSSESEEESDDEDELPAGNDEDYIQLSSDEDDPVASVPDKDTVSKEEEDVVPAISDDIPFQHLPALLSDILPSFFKSYPLNPIAKNGQKNIQLPDDLDIETQINSPPSYLLSDLDNEDYSVDEIYSDSEDDEQVQSLEVDEDSHQKKQERLDRLNEDPYYIASNSEAKKKKKTPKIKKILDEETISSENVSDVNSIPEKTPKKKSKKLKKEKVLILTEEMIGNQEEPSLALDSARLNPKKKRNILKIDSSNLDNFDLDSSSVSEMTPVVNDKNEYEVDLDELRRQLASNTLSGEKKKKKKKAGDEKKKSSKKPKEPAPESTANAEPKKEEQTSTTTTPDSELITIKKPKKTKKKKAIILD